MSIYQCDDCGCVENTALGWYHCRNMEDLTVPEKLGKKLCSVCGPTKYPNGDPIEDMGKWHGKFKRTFYKKGSLYTDEQGNVRDKETKKYPENGSDEEVVE